MFDTHQPIIATRAQANAANLALVQQFVILSVQVPLSRVSTDLDIVRAEREADRIPGILYGWKQKAYYDAWFERDERYYQAMEMRWSNFVEPEYSEYTAADNLLHYFACLPGFGPVKAGFVCQMAFGLSGCIDSNNAKRFGINLRYWHAWDFKHSSLRVKRRKVARYNDTVRRLGGTRALWDGWCSFVSQRDGRLSPDEVSALHTSALEEHWT